MKRIILFTLFLVLSFSSHSQSQTEKPLAIKEAEQTLQTGSYAIVVGINDYNSEDISDLKYCENDAKRFADALKAQGWDSNKINILTGSSATYEKIYKSVNSLVGMNMIPRESTVIFFFSGHGVRVDDKNYLVPWDGSADQDLVKNRNIKLDEIEESIRNSPFERKLMFIDACRNEFSRGSRDISASAFGAQSSPKGMKILLSTEKGQFSREDDTLKSGIFTYFLADGFANREADTDGDGVVVLGELEVYVAKKMQDYSFKTGKAQRMVSDGECDPLVPLAIVGSQPPPPPPKPKPVQPSVSEKSKWFSVKIELTNKIDGFEYTVVPETIDVEIKGTVSLIDSINSISNKISIDVSNFTEGNYELNPQTQLNLSSIFPNQVSMVSVKQATVGVEVKKNNVPSDKPFQPEDANPNSESKLAPDITVTTIDGENLTLSNYKGKKAVIVSIWATWAGPCTKEMLILQKFYEKHSDQVEIIAISYEIVVHNEIRDYIKTNKFTFKIVHDPDKKSAEKFPTEGIPFLAIISKDGIILDTQVGYNPNEDLIDKLQKMLNL